MKLITKIPSHYRQLGSDEVIRRGDLYKYTTLFSDIGPVGRAEHTVGHVVGTFENFFTFWRRCHVLVYQTPLKEKKKNPIEVAPLVSFNYFSSKEPWASSRTRVIRLIAANDKYMIGLDVNDGFQYKKFLRDKMSNVGIINFNTAVFK